MLIQIGWSKLFRYTLWNAEYRISLMRNFDITLDISKDYQHLEENGVSELKGKQSERAEGIARVDGCAEVLDRKQGDSLRNSFVFVVFTVDLNKAVSLYFLFPLYLMGEITITSWLFQCSWLI